MHARHLLCQGAHTALQPRPLFCLHCIQCSLFSLLAGGGLQMYLERKGGMSCDACKFSFSLKILMQKQVKARAVVTGKCSSIGEGWTVTAVFFFSTFRTTESSTLPKSFQHLILQLFGGFPAYTDLTQPLGQSHGPIP